MIVDVRWFRDRDGFWCCRVEGRLIRTPETSLTRAMELYRWRIAIAAGEWSDS